MSLNIISTLSRPYIASLVAGVGLSGYFLCGNASTNIYGVIPLINGKSGAPTLSTEDKLRAWTWYFEKAKVHLGSSTMFAGIAYATAAALSPIPTLRPALIAASAFQLAIVPYTMAAMMPTNNKLLKMTEEVGLVVPEEKEVNQLVHRWNSLHQVRIGLGTIAYLIGLCVLIVS